MRYNKELPHATGSYPNYLFLYKAILPSLRHHLVFKPDTQDLVTRWLGKIRSQDSTGKTVVFVGVHTRRTDYANQLKVNVSWFNPAANK